jgi:hypothetical protein
VEIAPPAEATSDSGHAFVTVTSMISGDGSKQPTGLYLRIGTGIDLAVLDRLLCKRKNTKDSID